MKSENTKRRVFWREEAGVIYFNIVSNGKTGKKLVEQLKKKGTQIGNDAKDLLLSVGFEPTRNKAYKIAVIKGKRFSNDDRITSVIQMKAEKLKFEKPNSEVAVLMWEKLSREVLNEMGLKGILPMHEPLIDQKGKKGLLGVCRDDIAFWICAHYAGSDAWWQREYGFAFVVPKI